MSCDAPKYLKSRPSTRQVAPFLSTRGIIASPRHWRRSRSARAPAALHAVGVAAELVEDFEAMIRARVVVVLSNSGTGVAAAESSERAPHDRQTSRRTAILQLRLRWAIGRWEQAMQRALRAFS